MGIKAKKAFDDFTYEFDWMFDKNANVNLAWLARPRNGN